jgi:hypothetical protein
MKFLDAVLLDSSVLPSELFELGVWTAVAGGVEHINGIFNRVSEVTDIGAYIEADGVSARYNVATAEVPAVALGDALTVREYDYRVVGIEPTGRGRTVLVLGL